MKSPFKVFFAFSRMERLGFSLLALALVLALGFRMFLAFTSNPKASFEDRRLADVYANWKENQSRPGSNQSSEGIVSPGERFYFDPNILDSFGFIRLGISARAVHGLLNWRKKGKIFRKAEDLEALYNLPPELFRQLKPLIRIQNAGFPRNPVAASFPDIPKIIELNTADSALLDRAISGVGPALAHKIVAYRRALGGFLRFDQLKEIYRFPDSTFDKIRDRLILNPKQIQPLDLNTADEARLSNHPYIGPKTAKNILLYRQGIGHYSALEQLREVPLMSDEIYRKIAPYIIIK